MYNIRLQNYLCEEIKISRHLQKKKNYKNKFWCGMLPTQTRDDLNLENPVLILKKWAFSQEKKITQDRTLNR